MNDQTYHKINIFLPITFHLWTIEKIKIKAKIIDVVTWAC